MSVKKSRDEGAAAERVSEKALSELQAVIDRSTRTAGAAVADSVGYGPRQMTARELVDFWREAPLVAMATVGAGGRPHIAPVHARLEGARLRLVVYDNALRRADLKENPRVAFSTWRADGAAAILYGIAREIPGSLREARHAKSGNPRRVVEIEVRLTRVYAMRPPERG